MVFLGVVPLGFAVFGNYLIPLQIGAKDMAFPRLNMFSYWLFFAGGLLMLSSFFLPSGPAGNGWTSYPPLSDISHDGQTVWLLSMFIIIISFSSFFFEFHYYHISNEGPRHDLERLPFLSGPTDHCLFIVTGISAARGAAFLQLFDRLLGTSFFLPSGLFVNGQVAQVSGGGNALLWQHLFLVFRAP